jgi:prolyl-tRNA editing enzyme YbaK/EbsC (Cys-tRNA(Pro) deacylase)
VPGELDLGRLADLPEALGLELSQIVETLIQELDRAVGEAVVALDANDLDGAGAAAHAGRNSALMIGAQPVLDALGALEAGASHGDVAAARTALGDVRESWPALRARLVHASRQ